MAAPRHQPVEGQYLVVIASAQCILDQCTDFSLLLRDQHPHLIGPLLHPTREPLNDVVQRLRLHGHAACHEQL